MRSQTNRKNDQPPKTPIVDIAMQFEQKDLSH